MIKAIARRWASWRDPSARRARRAARRRAREEAFADAKAWERRGGPTPTEVEQRSLGQVARRR